MCIGNTAANKSSGDNVNVAGPLRGGGEDIDVSPHGVDEQRGCLLRLARRGSGRRWEKLRSNDWQLLKRTRRNRCGMHSRAIAFLEAVLSSEEGESIAMVLLVVNSVGGRFLRDFLVIFVRR